MGPKFESGGDNIDGCDNDNSLSTPYAPNISPEVEYPRETIVTEYFPKQHSQHDQWDHQEHKWEQYEGVHLKCVQYVCTLISKQVPPTVYQYSCNK